MGQVGGIRPFRRRPPTALPPLFSAGADRRSQRKTAVEAENVFDSFDHLINPQADPTGDQGQPRGGGAVYSGSSTSSDESCSLWGCGNVSITKARASPLVRMRPSNCASSTADRISEKSGLG